MVSIAGTISDFRQIMHGTTSAAFVYRVMGWKYARREKTAVESFLFIGDSITQLWAIENRDFFASRGFINTGLGGQTSGQLRKSCRLDIIDNDPDAVHLICGINDIAENEGPVSDRRILRNISSIVSYCRARDIQIMIGSITPATTIPWNLDIKPNKRIRNLNEAIKSLCIRRRVIYIDYYSKLIDIKEDLRPKYTNDGLHLNREGYDAIEPPLLAAIERIEKHIPGRRPWTWWQ